ncbi:winged helix-turn-helix domain-containing protein [Nocardioides houyundeii]|uniref:winged helix-turn-helix domain-containing protein n=1 Tax=Nocardioides houyundeii TaxID=2045452 RepID=UPI000DF2AD30|nr:helix-turn-helix domain-containing protein [Nocardioides houyundeii]
MVNVHDPKMLRAIAHPLRNRILGELSAQGPLRAADLSAELDIPANQASFHLRQLAKYGLVTEAVGEGRDRRDRVWRLVEEEGLNLDIAAVEQQPGGAAAAAVFRSQAAAWAHVLVDAAHFGTRAPGVHRAIAEHALRLTDDEARELSTELNDVVQEWALRTRGRDPSRRTYLLLSLLQPHPGTQPEDGAEGDSDNGAGDPDSVTSD